MLLQIKHYILILLILLFYSGCTNKNEEEIDTSLESFPEIEYIFEFLNEQLIYVSETVKNIIVIISDLINSY